MKKRHALALGHRPRVQEERDMDAELLLSSLLALQVAGASGTDEGGAPKLPTLAAPIRLEAGGKPICADTGHAAPYVIDFDRDGKKDLLVGQFKGGTCRVYRNEGTDAAPAFGEYELLKAGKAPAAMQPG
jgi:hypothetical protein